MKKPVVVKSEVKKLVVVKSEVKKPVVVKSEVKKPVVVKSEVKKLVVVKSEVKKPVVVKTEVEKTNVKTEVNKKRRTFKTLPDIAIPKGMDNIMGQIQAPMSELQKMMNVDDQITEEEHQTQNDKFSMDIY